MMSADSMFSAAGIAFVALGMLKPSTDYERGVRVGVVSCGVVCLVISVVLWAQFHVVIR